MKNKTSNILKEKNILNDKLTRKLISIITDNCTDIDALQTI